MSMVCKASLHALTAGIEIWAQVFEDVLSSHESLVVSGSPVGECFRLVEVRILEERGDHPFLETPSAVVVSPLIGVLLGT